MTTFSPALIAQLHRIQQKLNQYTIGSPPANRRCEQQSDLDSERIDGMTELTLPNVVDYIRRRQHVSYVELKREFNAAGEYVHETVPNVFDMLQCSKELIEIVCEGVKTNQITAHPAHFLVYFADGEVPSLPIAKQFTKKGYKKPHWIPVVFNTPKAA